MGLALSYRNMSAPTYHHSQCPIAFVFPVTTFWSSAGVEVFIPKQGIFSQGYRENFIYLYFMAVACEIWTPWIYGSISKREITGLVGTTGQPSGGSRVAFAQMQCGEIYVETRSFT